MHTRIDKAICSKYIQGDIDSTNIFLEHLTECGNEQLSEARLGDAAVEALLQSGTMKQFMVDGKPFCSWREITVSAIEETRHTTGYEKAPTSHYILSFNIVQLCAQIAMSNTPPCAIHIGSIHVDLDCVHT